MYTSPHIQKDKNGCHGNVPQLQVLAIYALCWPTTQTPSITNCLVAIIHTKPVNSNISPKIGCHGNNPQSLDLGYVFIGQLDPEKPPPESNSVLLAVIQPKLQPIESQKLVSMATSLNTCGPPSNTIPWAHQSPQPKWQLDRFSRFCRLASVTDLQTDRPRYSVGNNSPHLRTQYCDAA